MNAKLHTGISALAAALVAGLTPVTLHAVAPERPVPIQREGEVLVKFRAGATGSEIQDAKARLGLVTKRAIATRRTELLALPAVTTTAAAVELLRIHPAVEHAEPNFRRFPRAVTDTTDPLFSAQWGLRNTGQPNFLGGPAGTPGADLNVSEAWDGDGNGTADRTGSPSVVVAVIDDAIQVNHPDLAPNVTTGHNFIGCQDPDNPSPLTSQGSHGTLVSGAAVARGNNGEGVAGVAWNATLMPLKFGFDVFTHVAALEYARDNGAHIVNASFGGPGFSQIEVDTLASLAANDILYVAAAGNDDSNTDVAQLNYPANYDVDNIITVAATDRKDNISSFSQYGPLSVDVAAPGVQVVTTAINSNYSTTGVSGTSFSSPYTAGVAALLKSHVMPQPGAMEMRARLIESGTTVSGANPKLMTTGGRVDADAALDMAPRPALVIDAMAFADGANNVPDPGETLDLTFTVRNLWLDATGVTASLAVDDADVTIDAAGQGQSLGTIAPFGSADATFTITVAGGITQHRYLHFTLTLAANGGAYTAERTADAELGTLTPGAGVSQGFQASVYDEFHAWHVDVADGTNKTLFVRTTTPGGEDIDVLVKRDVPPQYNITVGINPEVTAGLFCTSGTASGCADPATLLSAGLDGVEAVSIVDPQPGTYHVVIVNFDQSAVTYTIAAELLDGDLRPDPFTFSDLNGVPAGTYESSPQPVVGITGPTSITVAGGEYRINGGTYTALPGTVQPNDTVQLRATTNSSGRARAQVNIGGVTESFLVNFVFFVDSDPGERTCDFAGQSRRSGGGLPPIALVLLAVAVLTRRLRTA